MRGSDEPSIAFAVPSHEQATIEVRVNFGVFAGREVTGAEIERLAALLLDELASVTIVAEERYEVGAGSEASVHQVRIELRDDQAPADGAARAALEERLVERAEAWARACIADRHAELADGID